MLKFPLWPARAARLACLCLGIGALLTQAGAQGVAQISVNPAVRTGVSELTLGVTHTQFTALDNHGDPQAVASAQALLPKVATFQNQHLMGWGALNPEPAPGQFEWGSLDERLALIRKTGGTPVITLCCAPDWMKGGQAGTTDWSRLEVAPTPDHFDDFARLAAETARHFPDVLYFQVWNEFKGFYNRAENRWDYEGYTALYNKVYAALKAVNPRIQVGGPYVPFRPNAVTPGTRPARDAALRDKPYGSVDQRTLDAFDYWNAHKVGADFVTNDLGSYNKDKPPADPFAATQVYSDMMAWLRARTKLPIWWAEWYATSYSVPTFSPAEQNALQAVTLMRLARAGAAVALRWAPQGEASRCCEGSQESVWSDVRQSGGGQPFPLAATLEAFRAAFAPGTPLVQVVVSTPSVAALASPQRLLLANTTGSLQRVSVNQRAAVNLAPYEVRLLTLP